MKTIIQCYCFNQSCELSILYADSCVPVLVPLAVAISRTLPCSRCRQALVSHLLIDIKHDALRLLKTAGRSSLIVIDDDPLYLETIKRLLPRDKISMHFYLHALDALEWIKHASQNKPLWHTVVFLDLHMPVFDGWHFLQELAATFEALQQLVTVYIVSDSVDPGDKRRAAQYPFVRHLISKPLARHFCQRVSEAIAIN
jgi:CheY-like chemotaxis protein